VAQVVVPQAQAAAEAAQRHVERELRLEGGEQDLAVG
jgi:hypothetical protein